MKAAICYELNQSVRVEDVQIGAPQRNEVRVRMTGAGVCHSELSVTHQPDAGRVVARPQVGEPLNVYCAVGTMAEYAVVPANAAVKVAVDAPLDRAALLGCAVFNTAQAAPGSSVAVFGAGGAGLNAIQGAAIAGAGSPVSWQSWTGRWRPWGIR